MLTLLVMVTERVTEPVRHITAAAECVESENYAATKALDSVALRSDELGSQARAFQRMVREVAAREQRLKQAEEALRRSERHFRALIEKGRDIIAVSNREGFMIYQSPSIQRVLGYSPEEMIGKKALLFVHPDDRERVQEAKNRALETDEGTASVEYRMQARDGSWRDVASIITNALNDPAMEGVLFNSRDVTERKQTEQTGEGEGGRRRRQPGQEPVPGQHEPRAAHAAQRHHRLQRDAAGGGRGPGAGSVSPRPGEDPRAPASTCSS